MRSRIAGSNRCLLTSLLYSGLILLVALGTGAAASTDEPDDGLTAVERAEVRQLMAQVEVDGNNCIPALLIVDTTRRNACFGMYRLSQMTEPGWDLFGETVAWALDYQPPAEVRVFLATYNGTLDPEQRDEDGLAAYDYLINSFGIHPDSLDVGHQSALETNDFTPYDLVIYTNTYPRQLDHVLGPNIPFITTSVRQTELMGIGTGDYVLHEDRSYLYVADNGHAVTDGYDVGLVNLSDHMWMDATYPDSNGLALVTADTTCYFPPVAIEVSDAWSEELGAVDTMYISLHNYRSWLEMGGFDMTLQYNTDVMVEILDVLPGSIPADCGWEYFEWRVGGEANCGGEPCSDSLIRIVSVADVSSVPGSPACLADTNGSLAQIVFRFTADSLMMGEIGPVRFVWFDCGDNAVSNAAGDTLSVSNAVRDYFGTDITADSSLPTFCGTPDSCLTGRSLIRRVDFKSGAAVVFPPMSTMRGDVNLNGLAYEIADAVLFANALVYGPAVFAGDLEEHMEATNCNADGIPFTLEDYVYLWRVIYGDAPPLDTAVAGEPTEDTVWFVQDTLNKVVRMNYPDSVRGALLVFQGDLEPWGWDDSTRPFDGLYTRVLLDAFYPDTTAFLHDSLFYYTGEGNLVQAYASYDGIVPLPTAITGASESCCHNRGNFDGSEDGSVNIVDLIRFIQYLFLEGPPPPCPAEADVNADSSVDLSDIVRLIDFMFLYGEPLTPCD